MIVSTETAGRSDPDLHIDPPDTALPLDDRLPLPPQGSRNPLDGANEHAATPVAAMSQPASIRHQEFDDRSAAVLAAVDGSPSEIIVHFDATVSELAEIRCGNRCRLCGKRMAWPGPAGLVFADGTAECLPCADMSATLGIYFWSSRPRYPGPETAACRQHPISSQGEIRSGPKTLEKTVGTLDAVQQGLLSCAAATQTDRP
jgi:hypothetical protein